MMLQLRFQNDNVLVCGTEKVTRMYTQKLSRKKRTRRFEFYVFSRLAIREEKM
jgi:hypothetical protein